MTRRIIAIALVVASPGCSSTNKDIAIRPLNSEAVGAARDSLERGDTLFASGNHALALDAYRRAMRQNPADPHALNGVAISYAAMGRHDLARQFFELALARAPHDERIYRNFARSLMAQGQKADADALLAQLGGGAAGLPRLSGRPTLAQLAASGAVRPSRLASVGLERMSMGDVLLRTTGAPAALPGRMLPQLSTAIVTVADNGEAVPPVSLARELTAPIMTASVQAVPAPRAVQAKPVERPAAAQIAGATCAGDRAKSEAFRLPATGYSISLSPGGGDTLAKCASMAGGDEPDSLFEKLWAWSGRQG